jgi:hypothetical protein
MSSGSRLPPISQGVRFVGPSVTPPDGDGYVSWAEIHD